MMGVQRYRRKPEQVRYGDVIAARYTAGGDLTDLRAVANETTGYPVMAECALGDETVLLVRWERFTDSGSDTEYLIIRNGGYLAYNDTFSSLDDYTAEQIARWWEPEE